MGADARSWCPSELKAAGDWTERSLLLRVTTVKANAQRTMVPAEITVIQTRNPLPDALDVVGNYRGLPLSRNSPL